MSDLNFIKPTIELKIFRAFNYVFLIALALACVAPLVHVFAVSLSSSHFAAAVKVGFLPVGFTFKSYEFVTNNSQFIRSMIITVERTILGTIMAMMITVITAYPLSKSTSVFKMRTVYVWFFFITTLVGGGLIPTYLVVKETYLIDKIWALVIPDMVHVFNIILLLNFFKNLPKELEEAVHLDGGGHLAVLFKVFLPISKPALATLTLFCLVGAWNEWFHGMIYMNRVQNYPLQTFLRQLIVPSADINLIDPDMANKFNDVNSETSKAAQIFVATIPIIMVYPFLQKNFTKGLVLGSVKG